MNVSKVESHLHILRCLLHYHERMMMDGKCPVSCDDHKCETAKKLDGKCVNTFRMDAYSEALREAIRCVEFVHVDCARGMELGEKRIREADLANKKMRKEAESEGNKLTKYRECYRKLAFPFLFGHFISTILFVLIQLLLYLF